MVVDARRARRGRDARRIPRRGMFVAVTRASVARRVVDARCRGAASSRGRARAASSRGRVRARGGREASDAFAAAGTRDDADGNGARARVASANALLELAKEFYALPGDSALVAARALAARAREASGSGERDATRAACDALEAERGRWDVWCAYADAIARAAVRQRNRSAAKPRTRSRDRACRRAKARQGWSRAAMRARRVRSCVGCERMEARDEMFRVVRVKVNDGEGGSGVRVLASSAAARASGRSAYVCKTRCCVARATKNKSIHRALRCQVNKDVYEQLASEAEAIEDALGVDTSGLSFSRPEGTAQRWEAPGVWR